MRGVRRNEAKRLAGEALVEGIQRFLDRSSSPVSGGKFKKLLANEKDKSTLLDEGDMRAHITFEEGQSSVSVGVFDSAPEVELLKMFNHNTGDTLPVRQSIANPEQEFKKSIMNQVNKQIDKTRNLSIKEVKERANNG